jgi:hypothetical protein
MQITVEHGYSARQSRGGNKVIAEAHQTAPNGAVVSLSSSTVIQRGSGSGPSSAEKRPRIRQLSVQNDEMFDRVERATAEHMALPFTQRASEW